MRRAIMRLELMAVAIVLFAFADPDLLAQNTDTWRDRFLKEAPKAWNSYHALARNLQGTMRTITTVEGKPAQEDFCEIRKNARCNSMLEQSASRAGRLSVANPMYLFTLGRRSADVGWSIRDVAIRQDATPPKNFGSEYEGLPVLWRLTRMWTSNLPELVRQPAFRVLQATAIDQGGDQLVRIEFENRHSIDDKPFFPYQSGTLLLDPSRYWCLRSCSLDSKGSNGDGKNDGEYEIVQDTLVRYPVPKRVVNTVQGPSQRGQVVEHFDLSEPSSLPTDDAFTLSAYGFPEPFGETKPPGTRWYLWFGTAAVVFLLLWAVFRHRSRSLASRSSLNT